MRRSIFAATLAIAASWSGPASAQSKQCLESECFSERQVREFEVVDDDTLVIFVGRERCAYKVKVDPLYCNLTFLPDIEFFDSRQRDLNDRLRGTDSSNDLIVRQREAGSFNQRICTYSNSLALETFNFADTPNEAPIGRAPCEVLQITTISDDELLEVYVDEGLVPPPPPVGPGELSRANEDERGIPPESDTAETDDTSRDEN